MAEYSVKIKTFIVLLFFLLGHTNAQVKTLNEVVEKFDFGKEFKIKLTTNQKKFEYDFNKFNEAIIYYTEIDNKKYFLYQISEDCRFKFIFRGKYEYLNKNYGSVTDARDFLLYDKLKKKILLLESNNRGLISNMNDTLTIFNSISCLGRHVILLTNSLEEYKSLESENEYNCMNVFFDDDETNKNTQIQNNEMKVYKKILKTKDGNITQIEDINNRLFMMNLDTIYELLQ